MRDATFEHDGLKFHYVDYGGPADGAVESPALLLLHGLTGYARSWDGIAEPLTATHRVYALDQRGHGDSDHAPAYGVRDFAADCVAFADHLGLTRYALCGLSLGARNAMAVGGIDNDRLSHLVLVDMAPEMAREGARRIRSNIGGQVDLTAGFAGEDEAYAYQVSLAERPDDPAVQARLREGIPQAFRRGDDGRLHFKYDPELFVITGKAAVAEQPYLWECLGRIATPTLVVRGATSDILTPDLVARMLDALPNGRAVEIAGAGHPVPYDQPEAFTRALAAFLRA